MAKGQCEVCGAETSTACSKCKGVFYCSREHQLEARPFHRRECLIEAAIVRALAKARLPRPTPPDATCLYCLEHDDEVLSQGCACRGTAGFAHVACTVEGTKSYEKQSITCAICLKPRTGVFAIQLTAAYWRLHRRGDEWSSLTSCEQLQMHLKDYKEFDAALKLCQKVFDACHARLPPGHMYIYQSSSKLGCLFNRMGRFKEAREILEPLADGWQTADSRLEREIKLNVLKDYAEALIGLRHDREAERLIRPGLEACKRHLGEDNLTTLAFMKTLGTVAMAQGSWHEFRRETSALLDAHRRIYGSDHALTRSTEETFTTLCRAKTSERPS